METKNARAGLLMMISFSIILFSCGKLDLDGTSTVPSANTTGGIMDLGVAEGNVRGMQVSLSNVSISMYDAQNSKALITNRLNIFLYTESDGVIKDGTYHFSGTKNVIPFIFKSALVYMYNKETGLSDAFDVSGGTIIVARSGAYYTFNMNGTLSGGSAIRATFGGTLSYSD